LARIGIALLIALGLVLGAGSALAQVTGAPGETPARQGKLTKLPKLVKFVEAVYPEAEKKANRTASVTLQIAIDDHGAVDDVAVIQTAGPDFDRAAVEAVRQFVFSPAEVDGKPAPVKITYRYDFVIKQEAPQPVINFEGVVSNRFSKQPIVGAVIELPGVGSAKTDEKGHFEFKDVPFGKQVVTITAPGLTPVSTEEKVEKGKKLTVKYALEPKDESSGDESDLEIVVVGARIKKEVISTEIKVEEGRRIPGTQGDTLKVVQNLPGVARASFGSGQLVVWGAAPQDTRVYVDGVHIPLLYHGGGLRSTINSDLVRAIDLAPGGYGSEYGRGLGGLVTIDTRTLRNDRVHGYASADLIDASAMVETPVGAHTRVAVAGRKSYLHDTLGWFTDKDPGEFIPIPDYYDVQLKAEYDVRQNESVQVFGLASSDTITRTLSSPDPAQVKRQDSLTRFNRASLAYKRQLEDGSVISVGPWGGQDHYRTLSSFGGTPTELDVQGYTVGVRAGWRGKVSDQVSMLGGLDVEASALELSRIGSVTLPPREGDITVFGQPPADQVNADQWKATVGSIAPYFQADVALLDGKLHLVPGFRIEPFVVSGNRLTPRVGDAPAVSYARETTAVDPRLAVRYQMLPKLSFKAAAGIYHQAPAAEDLSSVFGNPTLGVSRAVQLLGGTLFKLRDDLSLEQVLFYSASQDLVTRSEQATPELSRALVQEGIGRAYGTQFLLRKELAGRFFGWISYTLMRSERRDHPNSDWRFFDYDQTHVLAVVGSYDLGRGFELGARFRYSTGYPRTPVVGSFYSARRDLYEPVFGYQNSLRIPGFAQLDVRFSKRFNWDSAKGELYLDLQNVTDRDNPEEIVYDYRFRERAYITGLPILPVLGGRFEW
jgi:TonB family protein